MAAGFSSFDRTAARPAIRRGDHYKVSHPSQAEILTVLRAERRDRQHRVGHVDALVVGQPATGDHFGDGEFVSALGHPQPELAVIQQQVRTLIDRGEDFRVGQGHVAGRARRLVEIEPDGRSRFQIHRAAGQFADAQLGSLQVGQDTDGTSRLGLERANDFDVPGVIGVRTVAEIETEHVRPALEKRPDHFRRVARGAEGRDDLGLTVAAHESL